MPSVPVAAAPVVTWSTAFPVVGESDDTPVASVTTAAVTVARCAYAFAVATLCASGSCAAAASKYARALVTIPLLPPYSTSYVNASIMYLTSLAHLALLYPAAGVLAFTNATVHVSPEIVINNATILEKNGIIINVGENIQIPENTRVYDKSGKHIYPSFIDLYSEFGIKKVKKTTSFGRSSQFGPSREGYYWNDHILSHYNSISDYKYDKNSASKIRKMGFGIVNSHRADGIHRGTGLLLSLNDHENDSKRILSKRSTEHYSFKKSTSSNQNYPGSIMGSIALIRQLNYDTKWYESGNSLTSDMSIEAIIENKKLNVKLGELFVFGRNDFHEVTEIKSGVRYSLHFAINNKTKTKTNLI